MEKAAHTPGPWTAATGWIKGPRGQHVASIPNYPYGDTVPNTQLLAAAPDLLAALRELIRCVRGGDETSGFSMDDALMDADTALSNFTGA